MTDINFAQSISSELFVNNKKVDSKGLELDYDGDDMNISGYKNNKQFNKKLSKNEILKLLATPCRKISLVDQLKRDFPLSSKKNSKNRRNKKPKKPPTKTKRHKKSSKKNDKTRRHKKKPKKTNKKSTRRHSKGGDGPTDEPSGP
tara:strand:+ start:1755 stop:2189 length:435 start_codon:yes stop_codon:yes gene_type:complete